MPYMLRYQMFAVDDYSCTLDALHIRQTRRLQDLGVKEKTIIKITINQIKIQRSRYLLLLFLVFSGGILEEI